jgi:hypothetical protein
VSVQYRCTVWAKHTIGSETIFDPRKWYSLVTRLKWKLVWVRLEIVLILTQDRCMVCAEHSIGSVIVLDAPNGTPRCVGNVESRFGSFEDSVSVGAI